MYSRPRPKIWKIIFVVVYDNDERIERIMPPSAFSPATVVVRNEGFMEAEVEQEIVALNVEKGMCYGLNPVGARVWQLLASPVTVAEICNTLVDEYQVDPDTCEKEVLDLLFDLQAEGMISQLATAGAQPDAKGRT